MNEKVNGCNFSLMSVANEKVLAGCLNNAHGLRLWWGPTNYQGECENEHREQENWIILCILERKVVSDTEMCTEDLHCQETAKRHA